MSVKGFISKIWFSLIASQLLIGSAHANEIGRAEPAPPPSKCMILRGSWCIALGVTHIELQVLAEKKIWTVYGTLNPKSHFTIEEPDSCGEVISDQMFVNNIKASAKKNNAREIKYTLAFNSKGKCNLRVTSALGVDAFDESYFLPFAVIRRCIDFECIGDSIGWEARKQVEMAQ